MARGAVQQKTCSMRTQTSRVLGTVAATLLALAVTACGSAPSNNSGPAGQDATSESPSRNPRATSEPSTEESPRTASDRELITAAGIAAIVQRHLGQDRVKMFGVFDGDEPGSVGLWIQMRGAGGPENFSLSLYSPQATGNYMGRPGQCPAKTQRMPGKSRCRVLENDRTVMINQMAQGFSDDNAKGMVISGTVVTRKDGSALSMYESYDRSPTITMADLEQVLGDPNLTWRTDAAVNQAGEKITVRRLDG